MMKDEIVFKEKKLSTQCSSCGAYDHSILDCTMVTPHFNKFRTVIKHIYPVVQKRQAIIRERAKFQTYKRNSAVRDDLKKVRNQLTQKFMDSAEIDEVSDENEYSDGEDENYPIDQQKKYVNDDKEYFMKQKMQFRQIDGYTVNYETENTHNYFTDDYQSLVVDNMNQIILQNGQPYNFQIIGQKDVNLIQNHNDPIPDIVVQRKDKKQLSIIKNNMNSHTRSNSIMQKQSLFRTESQAAQSSDIQKEDQSQKGNNNAQKQDYSIPQNGRFTTLIGQNHYDGTKKDEENRKINNFDSQATLENLSIVGFQNNQGYQGVNATQNEYFTQQNLRQEQHSNQYKSIDQSIDENKNLKTISQAKKQNNKKKQSLTTTEQLQKVSEKLQILHQMQNEKEKKQKAKNQKKRVSIQIDGNIQFQEIDKTQSDENIDDDIQDKDKNQSHIDIEDEKNWSNDTKNSKPQQQTRRNSKELDFEDLIGYKSPKSAISAPYPSPPIDTFLMNINQNTVQQNEQFDKLEDNLQQKINQKLINYSDDKITERKSEQSVQELEISSMLYKNNQQFRQKSRENSNSFYQLSKNSFKTPTKQINLEPNARDDIKIDINSLHQYNEDSSLSIPWQRQKNSIFQDFNKSSPNQSSLYEGDQPLNSPSPKLNLDPSVLKEYDQQNFEPYDLNEQDQPIESDDYDLTEGHPTPVGTPSHRRITIQAEKIFGQIRLQQEDIEEESSMSHQETHNTPLDSDSPQNTESQTNNQNRINNIQLTSVQEILTRNSNEEDLQNNSHNSKRKLSIKSNISRQSIDKAPPLFNKSISHNYQQNLQLKHNISSIRNINNSNNPHEIFIQTPNPNKSSLPRFSINYFNDVNNITSNNSNLIQNFLPDNDKYTNFNKNPMSYPGSLPDQQTLHSQASMNQSSQTSGVINYISKEQINRQQSFNQNQNPQFNTTNEMRKMMAKNKAKNKHFTTLHDDNLQGAALYGIHQYGQAPINNQPKQYLPLQVTRLKMKKNPSQIQNHGNPNTPSNNGISQSKKNISYPPTADSFSQQVLYHQKYFQGKSLPRNSIQLQHGQSIINQGYFQGIQNDNNHLGGGGLTPKKRQQTMVGRYNTKGQQFGTNYGQQNNSIISNHNSFAIYNRGRNPSLINNSQLQYMNNLQVKSESQNNLPFTEEQYDEDFNEYESVSNADLYIYDFDKMKEYKKYYPLHNFKKVISDCLRKRKPFVVNKSIHNNTFIQKIMQKKKKIPRRLPSLMRQFDIEYKQQV